MGACAEIDHTDSCSDYMECPNCGLSFCGAMARAMGHGCPGCDLPIEQCRTKTEISDEEEEFGRSD